MYEHSGKKIRFLFWNICKKDLSDQIINLVQRHEIDILLLAECQIPETSFTNKIANNFSYSPDQNEKIKVFTNFNQNYVKPISDSRRYTIRLLNPPGYDEVILVCLHLVSKNHNPENIQFQEAIKISHEIRKIEEEFGNSKIIVVGDFNMNPFEYGMVSHMGFNTVMTQELAKQGTRVLQSEKYSLFYNPMWSLFGDLSRGVSGTYFYKNNYQWQMFDQVIFSPKIIKNVDFNELEIITTDGVSDFLNKNDRINTKYSDHLPIKFVLYL